MLLGGEEDGGVESGKGHIEAPIQKLLNHIPASAARNETSKR
jgi:hypothetical protein